MNSAVFWGIMIPFFGTSIGAACVYFMHGELHRGVQRALEGFAAGVMVAASVWSLLIPAMDYSSYLGKLAFAPAALGFWFGTVFLLALDHWVPHMHLDSDHAEGMKSHLGRSAMMILAVTMHNLPEGMAVGVVFAGWMTDTATVSTGAALALSVGIALQNLPEGAIISMPLRAQGCGVHKAFLGGVASGIVEPIGAFLAFKAAAVVVPALPFFLSFAAGAMIYVVVEELIPEMSTGEHSNIGVISFATGFSLMMVLDVALA